MRDRRIILVKPTKPGYLLVKYLDKNGEQKKDVVSLEDAPRESEVQDSSPALCGPADEDCPHCESRLVDLYIYKYYAKIVNGKVYAFDTSSYEEVHISKMCNRCEVKIFEWEIREPYIDYIDLSSSPESLKWVLRSEPMAFIPGECPGVMNLAVNDSGFEATCSGYPKCERTHECVPNWSIQTEGGRVKFDIFAKVDTIEKLIPND